MSDDDDEEEVLLYVEINGLLDTEVLDEPQPFFKLIGLDTDQPIMQIGREVFSGEYRDVPGTAMFFEEDSFPPGVDPVFGKVPNVPLRYVCKTNKSLIMNRVFLKEKSSGESKEESSRLNDEVVPTVSSSSVAGSTKPDKGADEEVASQVLEGKKENVPKSKSSDKSNVHSLPNEPTPGPSWASDIPSLDVFNILSDKMDPSTLEIAKLVAEQMNISSDINLSNFKKD